MEISISNIQKLHYLIRMSRITRKRRTMGKRRGQRGGGKFDQLPLKAIQAVESNPGFAALKASSVVNFMTQSGFKKDTAALLVADPSIEKKVKAELDAEWDFQLLMAHGEILPGMTAVPADTYVIFNSPAGCISLALNGLPSQAFVGPHNVFYTQMAQEIVQKSGSFNTTDPDIRGLLMADSCYPESIFTLPRENFTRKTKFSNVIQKDPKLHTLTIYGPGEPLYNMKMTFVNNTYQTLYLGLFELPIAPAFHAEVVDTIGKLKKEQEFAAKQLATQSEATMRRIVGTAGKTTSKYDEALFKRAPNLKPEYVSTTKTLDEILKELPPVPAGKKRLLFIGACRGICQEIKNKAEVNITRGLRRGSLSEANMAAAVAALKAETNRLAAAKAGHVLGAPSGATAPAAAALANENITVNAVKALLRESRNRATPVPRLRNLAKTLRNIQTKKTNVFKAANAALKAELAEAALGGK
jgi:hypothetical protein